MTKEQDDDMKEIWSKWQAKRVVLVTLFTAVFVLGMQYTTHGNGKAVTDWILHYPQYFLCTIVFIGGAYYLLTCGIHFGVATVIVGLLSWIWGILNYLKFTMREEYVTGDEVLSFFRGELTFTSEDITPSRHLLFFGVVVLFMVIVSFFCQHFLAKKKGFRAGLKIRLVHMLCGLLVTLLVGFGIYFSENLSDYMSDGEAMEKKYGLMLSFIPSNTLPHLISNADYSPLLSKHYVREGQEPVADIDGTDGTAKKTGAGKVHPNIIIIMSESLYDTDHFDNVEVDRDVMEVMHRYQNQYGGGSMAVDIFGGGTANTEYEFLTGLGHKYFGNNLMYYDYIKKGQMSMVGYMKQLGYHTVAIHPYKESFFNRKNAYENLGFDEMYFKENMKYTDDLFDVNISDYCLTKEIIDKYEKNKEQTGQPYFNFSVSVGTHKPCLDYDKGEPYEYQQKVKVLPKEGNFDSTSSRDVRRYYNAVQDTNEAFEQLVEYFEQVEEPTVILLFGDHAPPLSDTAYEQITTKDLTDEELYQTPVVTWNNYNLPRFEVENINANYLSAVFLSYLDFPLPKACVYNQNLLKYWYHTNTKKCVKNARQETITEFDSEEVEMEKATLSMYQDALKMKDSLIDLWDVPTE